MEATTMNRMCWGRRTLACGLLGTVLASGAGRVDAADQKVRGSAVAFTQNREVLILYKAGQADEAAQKAKDAGFEIVEDYKPGLFLRCVPGPGAAAVTTRVNQVAVSEAVRTVEPNYIVSIPRPPVEPANADVAAQARANKAPWMNRAQAASALPNDTRFGELWGMANIRAPLAWETNDKTDVVVAVIDTGVDFTHEDLKDNMWKNPGESGGGKETNGVDDDGNGIKDDVFGARFLNSVGNGNPKDDNEHGTHCAGTIGAVGNNMKGVVGVNWKMQIMALKFLNASGSGATNDAVRCIDYAIDQKNRGVNVKVLSNSWGGGGDSQALRDAITRAEQAGMLFVAAAGNENEDNDATPNFPSNYPNNNLLAVAAIDIADKMANFSNFGATTVDIGAPGVGILSSVPNNGYEKFSGTSMATPHVAGAAALAMAHPAHKSKSAVEIKTLLMQNARPLAALAGKCVTGGTLDIGFLVSTPPPPVIFPQNVAYTGNALAGNPNALTGTFVLQGQTGEASYSLGPDLYKTLLEAQGVETTADGFEGFVYREDFPTSPFEFLITRNPAGPVPYHRVYVRFAGDPSTAFVWFVDASPGIVITTSTSDGAETRRKDSLKRRIESLKSQAQPEAAGVAGRED